MLSFKPNVFLYVPGVHTGKQYAWPLFTSAFYTLCLNSQSLCTERWAIPKMTGKIGHLRADRHVHLWGQQADKAFVWEPEQIQLFLEGGGWLFTTQSYTWPVVSDVTSWAFFSEQALYPRSSGQTCAVTLFSSFRQHGAKPGLWRKLSGELRSFWVYLGPFLQFIPLF
jgi:hypothetical protein